MDYGRWTEFKKSEAYQDYRKQISSLASKSPHTDVEVKTTFSRITSFEVAQQGKVRLEQAPESRFLRNRRNLVHEHHL
jgi:hypothetical protein